MPTVQVFTGRDMSNNGDVDFARERGPALKFTLSLPELHAIGRQKTSRLYGARR